MSISTPFIRRPIATSLLTAAILLAGLVVFPLLPVAPLPNVEFPTLVVTASYPGASPETMASTVATPLETEFGEMLPGLAQMTSTSVLGSTQITLQFDLSTDIKSQKRPWCWRRSTPRRARCRRRCRTRRPSAKPIRPTRRS